MFKFCMIAATAGIALEIGNRACIAHTKNNPRNKSAVFLGKGIKLALKGIKVGVGSYALIGAGINLLKER